MKELLEQQVRYWVSRLEAARAMGLPTEHIEEQLQELRAQQGGPQTITGTSNITMPMPKDAGR
jgi:hypothetical protein